MNNKNNLLFFNNISILYILYGLFLCYFQLAISTNVFGILILVIFFILLFLKKPYNFFIVLLLSTIFYYFTYNTRLLTQPAYLYKYFNLQYYQIELLGEYMRQVFPLIISLFTVYYLFHTTKKLPNFLKFVLIMIIMFTIFYFFYGLIICKTNMKSILSGIRQYNLPFIMTLWVFLSFKNSEKVDKYFIKTIFYFGIFQIIILFVAELYSYLSINKLIISDSVAGTTMNSTTFVFIASFSLIYLLFFDKNEKYKLIKLIFLSLFIFLAQSNGQSIVLIITITITFLINNIEKVNIKNNMKFIFIIFIGFILFNYFYFFFPELTDSISYAKMIYYRIIENPESNPKLIIMKNIISQFNTEQLFFGQGSQSFYNQYAIDEILSGKQGMANVINTGLINLFYDYGILGTSIVFLSYFSLLYYFLKYFFQTRNSISLYGFSVIIFFLGNFLLFPIVTEWFTQAFSIILSITIKRTTISSV